MQRVLLVDRDLDSRAVYRTILRYYGYDVLEASDGETALQMARDGHPDVMVTELTVPGKSGLELLAELRADSTSEALRVIVLTAIALESERTRAFEAGCQSVLVKPLEPRLLIDEIRRLLP